MVPGKHSGDQEIMTDANPVPSRLPPTPAPQQPSKAEPGPMLPLALVTGGSDGIGLAIAKRLAAEGRDLVLIARGVEGLEAARRQIVDQHPVRVSILPLDLTASDATAQIDRHLAEQNGFADLVVNSAGIGLAGPLSEQSKETIDQLMALNMTALTRIMRHFAPQMQERGRGGFLNVASLGGYVPGPNQAAYYASKAYVISLSEALATELRSSRVRVAVVCPGPVQTAFHARMGANSSLYRVFLPASRPDTVARWAVLGYKLGLTVILPGIISLLTFVMLRLVPHRIGVPLVGALLKPRRRETHDV